MKLVTELRALYKAITLKTKFLAYDSMHDEWLVLCIKCECGASLTNDEQLKLMIIEDKFEEVVYGIGRFVYEYDRLPILDCVDNTVRLGFVGKYAKGYVDVVINTAWLDEILKSIKIVKPINVFEV